MTKRGNGEGSITRRKDGRWQAALTIGGRRTTLYGKTQREARQKLDDLKLTAGIIGQLPERKTLDDLLTLWLDSGRSAWKPATLADYQKYSCLLLKHVPGQTTLRKITAPQLQLMVNRERPTPRKAAKLLTVAKIALGFGVRMGWLAAPLPDLKSGQRTIAGKRHEVWVGVTYLA